MGDEDGGAGNGDADERRVEEDGNQGEVPEVRARVGRRRVQRRARRAQAEQPDHEAVRCEPCNPVAIPMRKPDEPTAKEKAMHDVSHVPYRSWCLDCVRGRGVESPHRANEQRDEDTTTLVSSDYGFMKDDEGQGQQDDQITILASTDSKTQSVSGMIVPAKGAANQWIVNRLAQWIDKLGHTRIRFRTDRESPIIAVAKELQRVRGHSDENNNTILEPARTGDKRANGAAERAVRTVKDMFRTLKVALERSIKATIPPESDILR